MFSSGTNRLTQSNFFRAHHAAALVLAALTTAPALAEGETIIVNTIDDVVDFRGAQQVADLPGRDGKVSFREAVTAANNTPGAQIIIFNIPMSEWWLFTDVALMRGDTGAAFQVTDDNLTVDGTSQTAFTGDTNPFGPEIAFYNTQPNSLGSPMMIINADNCLIKGFGDVFQQGYAFQISGNNNRVIGCKIGAPLHAAVYITGGFGGPTPTGNIIGGTTPEESNDLGSGDTGLRIDAPADGNIATGNILHGSFSGVQIRGSEFTTTPKNNRIGGPTPGERNIISGSGHYGEEGFPDGTQVDLELAEGTIIEGNFIGTTADGTASANQIGPVGISVVDSDNTIIRNNLISGIAVDGTNHHQGERFGDAVAVTDRSDGTIIQGNLIGTDVTGTLLVPNHFGIVVAPALANDIPTNTTIGGTAGDEGNVVAFNELDGVIVSFSVTGTSIRGNSIHDNGRLGIDLLNAQGAGGVTPNDPGDADQGGGNMLQNFPVLTSAVAAGGAVTITGTLNSAADQLFDLDFYSNAACDSSGNGEGEKFLGSTTVTTNGSGNVSFEVTLAAPVATDQIVTSTATDSGSNTSEFSACQTVSGGTGGLPGDIDADGDVDLVDLTALLAAYGSCSGDPAYIPAGDLDSSGCIDLLDLSTLLTNYGS